VVGFWLGGASLFAGSSFLFFLHVCKLGASSVAASAVLCATA
jgi:hypothetical protein